MDRLRESLADRYEISRELGVGGMATVFLARDLRHDREVAIKVLHPDLAAALGGERFLTEIKTTARLQHPHILPLLDSGRADGQLFYVMPYVRGESLRDRLQREAQLPVADALRIASEVADALACAHEAGIIHRDIKPENILLQSGHAVVADFGIALAVQQAGTERMTQTGLSLGTPQYMAPEQAMGDKNVDHRADVYALAAVTYEMLVGEPPHTGANAQAIVAKLLTETVRPIRVLRPAVPEHVDAALAVALEKLPADRFGTVREFADALRGSGELPNATRAAIARRAPTSRTSRIAIALNVLLAAALVAMLVRPRTNAEPSRQQVVLWRRSMPAALAPGATWIGPQAAISPDGATIVFSDSVDGAWRLLRKRRGDAMPERIEGTEGALSPTISPDGAWIGYTTTAGQVKKIPIGGGTPIIISDNGGREWKSIAWLDDNSIVHTQSDGAFIVRRPSSPDGELHELETPQGRPGAVINFDPLPKSRGVLVSLCSGNCSFASDLYVFDFAKDSMRLIVPKAVGGWYSPTGHVLFTGREGGLFAVKFDLGSMSVTSDPIPVLDRVAPGRFSMSRSGAILYGLDEGTLPSQLVWVTRSGVESPVDSTWKETFEYPAISPDGRSIAVSVTNRTTSMWIRSADGSRRMIDAPLLTAWRPAWFPDGRSLLFSGRTQPDNSQDAAIWRVGVGGDGLTQILRRPRGTFEAEVTRDTQWVIFRVDNALSSDIYARRLHGDTTILPIAEANATEVQIAISPDGKWLAYCSGEQGDAQIYVMSFPDKKQRRLASRDRSCEPRWSRDGKELYFVDTKGMQVVSVGAGSTLTLSEPRLMFRATGYRRARNRQQFDVAPDGQRFLMIKDPPSPPVPPVVLAEHWLDVLKAKLSK